MARFRGHVVRLRGVIPQDADANGGSYVEKEDRDRILCREKCIRLSWEMYSAGFYFFESSWLKWLSTSLRVDGALALVSRIE